MLDAWSRTELIRSISPLTIVEAGWAGAGRGREDWVIRIENTTGEAKNKNMDFTECHPRCRLFILLNLYGVPLSYVAVKTSLNLGDAVIGTHATVPTVNATPAQRSTQRLVDDALYCKSVCKGTVL